MKLYKASINISADTVFIVPTWAKEYDIEKDAMTYLREEMPSNKDLLERMKIEEITNLQDIPNNWESGLIYGTDGLDVPRELTPEQALKIFLKIKERDADPDYQEYLRLKKKYE